MRTTKWRSLALWGLLMALPGCVLHEGRGSTTVMAEGWVVVEDLRGWAWVDVERWQSSYRGRVEYRQTECGLQPGCVCRMTPEPGLQINVSQTVVIIEVQSGPLPDAYAERRRLEAERARVEAGLPGRLAK